MVIARVVTDSTNRIPRNLIIEETHRTTEAFSEQGASNHHTTQQSRQHDIQSQFADRRPQGFASLRTAVQLLKHMVVGVFSAWTLVDGLVIGWVRGGCFVRGCVLLLLPLLPRGTCLPLSCDS